MAVWRKVASLGTAVALAVPLVAQARDMTGKAGVGVLAASDGTPYMTFRYWRTALAIELMAGWRSHNASTDLAGKETSDLRLALGLMYRWGDQPRASLSVGLRPWLIYHTEKQPTDLQPVAGFSNAGVELPIQAELFLTDNIGVQAGVGAMLLFGASPTLARTTLQAGAAEGSTLLTLTGGFGGGLGAAYYF